jgi:thiamine kinase-like enzyme
MRPASEEFINLFQVDVTFVKECGIYNSVAPALINLQKERGVPESALLNLFCKCYASRFSLDPGSEVVDADALMVFENLTYSGFITGDRRAGFKEKDTLFILENLAKVHATTVVLKLSKPEVFQKEVRPYLNKIDVDAGLPEEAQEKYLLLIEQDLEKINEDRDTIQQVIRQIRANRTPEDVGEDDRPFCSMLHNDFWVNNMMIAYGEFKKNAEKSHC